jgi:hypothetical protein
MGNRILFTSMIVLWATVPPMPQTNIQQIIPAPAKTISYVKSENWMERFNKRTESAQLVKRNSSPSCTLRCSTAYMMTFGGMDSFI